MKRNRRLIIIASLACLLSTSAFSKYDLAPASTKVPIGDTALLEAISKAFGEIASHAKKALVFISVSKTMRNQEIDPFEFFFNDRRFRDNEAPMQKGLGSGFFIDLDKGYILTNNHVVEGADTIDLKLANGQSYKGKILGRDEYTDVAVVQVTDEKFSRDKLTSLVLGDSDQTKVAELVMALGAPFGLEASISTGVVSATGRGSLQIAQMGDFIQTDAAINPGNSGGPLVDVDGRVIGINSAIYSRSGAYNGIGFAVPANLARKVATNLINGGHSIRGFIGVSFQPLAPEWSDSLGLPKNVTGVIIAQVTKDGPAEKAGLETGDVITEVNGKSVADGGDLTSAIGLMTPGTDANITYYRESAKKTTVVKIETWPGKMAVVSDGKHPSGSSLDVGIRVAPLNPGLKRRFGSSVNHGLVIVEVKPDSAAAAAGLSEGDVITNANGRRVGSPQELEKAIKQSKNIVVLQVERNGQSIIRPLKKG